MKKFIQYLRDVRSELSKVSWPTWNEVRGATVLVVVLSVVVSLYVFACDQLLLAIMGYFLGTN
ncbi:hypothetical protein CHISP_1620 [Chitinispirillum alkaliphilum]|nr:hypothetical protein CHISP_1620 [Chitinispirillum alkaliphilum]